MLAFKQINILRGIVHEYEGIKNLKYNIVLQKYNFILNKHNFMHNHLKIMFLIKRKEIGEYHKLVKRHNIQEGINW